MCPRKFNFSAGPAALPTPVLERAREEMLEFDNAGASIMEISHRSKEFDGVLQSAKANLKSLLNVPDNYKILFVHGGATMQFSLVAMNFLRASGKPADYIVTGSWGEKAIKEGKREGDAREAWSGKGDNYIRVPGTDDMNLSDDPAYVHFTSNETIQGVQFATEPDVGGAPLICDASSDILSRPIPIEKYAMIYGGLQKNVGPSGVAFVILRDDMLERVQHSLHSLTDYRVYADKDSCSNTPNTFAIYMVNLVTDWLINDIGGLDKMTAINEKKAPLLYDAIDASGGFYVGHAEKESRSKMNVAFRLADDALDKSFLDQAANEGLIALKGHRSVGGMRASIYNAMPIEGVQKLADFMKEFQSRNS